MLTMASHHIAAEEIISSGTGFYVTRDCHVITNLHVISDAEIITVIDSENNEARAEVVSLDQKNDLALLKTEGKCTPLNVEHSQSTRKGDSVQTLGFPMPSRQGRESKLTTGIVSSLSGFRGDPTTIQISTPIQPGNSGGPLLNERGRVVGVIVAKLNIRAGDSLPPEGVNYAIKSSILIELINSAKSLGVKGFKVKDEHGKPLPLPLMAESAEPAVVLVISTRRKESTAPTQAKHINSSSPPKVTPGENIILYPPTDGAVVRKYSETSKGIGYKGIPGSSVVAASPGVVVYSGSGLKGYGNLIIIKHEYNYLTAYALNRRLFAREGERVIVGQLIGEVGDEEEVTGENFYFELRHKGNPIDPTGYFHK